MDRRVDEIVRLLESSRVCLPVPHWLDHLAESVHLSGSRLRHIFHTQTGVSLGHFLSALRLKRAKELLETSHLSVKEVMAETGMSDQSYFVQAFKKLYGVTPGYYRSHAVTTTPRPPPPARAAARKQQKQPPDNTNSHSTTRIFLALRPACALA